MTMFLIQSLLWLLAAFFLGYGLGRWLKGVFCKRRAVETQTKLETDTSHLRVPVTTAAVAAGTAATAALARSREPIKPTVNVSEPELKAPVVTAKTPELKATVMPLKADIELPKTDLKAPVVSVTPPTVDVNAPVIDLPKVEVSVPAVELPTIEVAAPKVDVHLPKLDIQAPQIEVDVPKLDIELPKTEAKVPLLDLPKVDVELPTIDLPKVDVSAPKVDLNLPQVEVNLPKADLSLPQVDVELPTIDLSKVDVSVPRVDLNLPQVEVNLPKADLSLPQVDVELPTIDLPKVDVSAPKVDLNLPQVEVNLPKADLSLPQVDVELPTIDLSKVDVSAPKVDLSLPQVDVELPTIDLPKVEVNVPEVAAPKLEVKDIATGIVGLGAAALGVAAANIKVPDGELDLTVTELVKPPEVDGDLKTLHLEVPASSAEISLIPTHTTVQDLAPTGLTLAAAGAATVAAVQANLQSGAQPMIVDESDAIEAIKLAWDGELSPTELAALEHTLILRPGETGRLGLVTCSVPNVNCVSLGGLEGDLKTGEAMRSKLFNMAVTHHDDGNYIFSSLTKWLPDWISSGEFSEHTDELTHLVWDNDPSAVEHPAGYQLILREGQYGDLGLVSCAVNEAGSVSLGGLVGSIAEGQTVVSKLYGILIERAGDVYIFKQFSKPASADSWINKVQAVVTAVGTGIAVQASGAVDTVKDAILPATKSITTDRLEPELASSEDQSGTNVRRLIEESHDRRGSKLVSQLWDSDSGYDCSVIEGEESLILKPGLYGKLGSVHCGVTKPGRVVVSGDVSPLAEGEGVLFHLYSIVVCRDDEDNYRFERLKDLV